jgi:hypothetical protein
MENNPENNNPDTNTYFNKIMNFLKSKGGILLPFILILAYVIAFYVIYFKYPQSFKQFSIITNIIFVVVGLLLFLYLFARNLKTISPYATILQYFKQIGILFIILAVIFGALYLLTNVGGISYLLTFIINIGLLVTFLGLLYVAFQKIPFLNNLKQKGIFKLLYHYIFLIPCYMFDAFIFLKKDIQNTPAFIFKLLLLNTGFIILYFLLPTILNTLLNHNGKVLLKEPKYLNQIHTLGKYEDFDNSPNNNSDIFNYTYNYGLSAWIYIDEQQPNMNENSNKYTSVLNYGNKPNISYNVEKQSLKITMKTGNDNKETSIVEVYETNKLPLQKWNNIVINYTSGIMDVFINDKLVATQNNLMPYMDYDDVISGKDNGVKGGICNVIYFNKPIERSSISWNYSIMKNHSPPYF